MLDWFKDKLDRKRWYQEAKLNLEALGHDDLAEELEKREGS